MRTDSEASGWTGWAIFAAVMMMMVGAFQAIAGLTALFNDTYFLVTKSGLTLELDYTTWGWIHLGLGAAIILAGVSVMRGSWYGRVIGMLVAGLSAVANLVEMAAYPLWSLIIITVDVLIIYSLAVHGGELRESPDLTATAR
jgi:hypothetical protein